MKSNNLTVIIVLVLLVTGCNQNSKDYQISPDSNEIAKANLNLGVEYMNRGDYEQSLETLNKALDADSDYIPTLNALGLLYQKLGENDKAEGYFKRALDKNKTDPNTLNNYGLFLCKLGRYEQAQKYFESASKNPLYSTPEISLANAGTCALQNNNPDDADKFYRKALEKNPKISIALINMSQISYDKGNYLSARGYLQRYLAVAKHTPKSLWLGIQIEQQLGDKNTLSSYILLLKNRFPDSDEAAMLRKSGIK